MSDKLRQKFNKIELMLDWVSLKQEKKITKPAYSSDPITAQALVTLALPECRKLDKSLKLKMIVAPDGIDSAGLANHWELFFDLPNKRSKLNVDWKLDWNDQLDSFAGSTITYTAKPFPPRNSPLWKLVLDGKLLYRQLNGLWFEERTRTPDLPLKFIDSPQAVAALKAKHPEITFDDATLVTSHKGPNQPTWQIQTRTNTYSTDYRNEK